MNVSFDGLRKNATTSMNIISNVLERVIKEYKGDFYYDEDKEIIDAFNRASMFVDTFNCLFDDSVVGDMNDLSEKLSIKTLTEEEEKE